ncbi:MarC family protein [uncultured Propionibacterium sp.]|uniref:MarC family protein n=1 Tax=uncultured Propionibacterium sp. TaxID=218066 RepID=UPI0029313FC7|nr:MarC family protein [uncultured Propionibacterium sp.]
MNLVLSSALTLFLVLDPLGNIPIFLTALRKVDRGRRQLVLTRELCIALLIMLAFLLAGRQLLSVLHVTQPALATAGGLILLLIAIKMMFPTPESNLTERTFTEPFIVPLAVPYTAGPSALATEIIMANQHPDGLPQMLAAVALAWLPCSIILFFSGYLNRWLGERFLTAVERLMGMILVIVSTQMLLGGIRDFFQF